MSIPVFDVEVTPEPISAAPLQHRSDALWAVGGFLAFCTAVLLRAPKLLEPDDLAYRASIAALSHGQLVLTNAQYLLLRHTVGSPGIMQWHHMASGMWVSEKNPGYPFVAALFAALGLLRLAPLAMGAIAAIGLFHGATKWLGRPAGAIAVWLYLGSGAALTFGWRATMPSFTDASLVAAGAGFLLWALLPGNSQRQRRTAGVVAFACLDVAVAIRYTNVLFLTLSLLIVLVAATRLQLHRSVRAAWAAVAALGVLGILAFNSVVYGHPFSTGYTPGEISFAFSALWTNIVNMPAHLTAAMPVWLLAAASIVWLWASLLANPADARRRRDAAVATGLGTGWVALWALYGTYTWTATQFAVRGFGGDGPDGGAHIGPHLAVAFGHLPGPGTGDLTVHVIRFYLPALGLLALLATWTLMRLPRPAAFTAVALLSVAGLLSFNAMAATGAITAPFGQGGPPGPDQHVGPPRPITHRTTTTTTRPRTPSPSTTSTQTTSPTSAGRGTNPTSTTSLPPSTSTSPSTTSTTTTMPVTTTTCFPGSEFCRGQGGDDDGGGFGPSGAFGDNVRTPTLGR